jgi:hypothetical protein
MGERTHIPVRPAAIDQAEMRRRLGQVYALLIAVATQKTAAGRAAVSGAGPRPVADSAPASQHDADPGYHHE